MGETTHLKFPLNCRLDHFPRDSCPLRGLIQGASTLYPLIEYLWQLILKKGMPQIIGAIRIWGPIRDRESNGKEHGE